MPLDRDQRIAEEPSDPVHEQDNAQGRQQGRDHSLAPPVEERFERCEHTLAAFAERPG